MEKVVSQLKERFSKEDPSYEALGEFVKALQVDDLDYHRLIPETDGKNYAKHPLLLNPLECVIINWPPGAESAVHLHNGFCGYVWVLEGEGGNIEYIHQDDKLWKSRSFEGVRGDIFDEPDGVIHKIVNNSSSERMVTVHFYYPAQDALEDMVIYDLDNARIGVLSDKAHIASFDQPRENFKEFWEKAFVVSSE